MENNMDFGFQEDEKKSIFKSVTFYIGLAAAIWAFLEPYVTEGSKGTEWELLVFAIGVILNRLRTSKAVKVV